jgi:hypothetical protein
MAALTSVTKVASFPAPAGGDGMKCVMGTAVGSASYDTGGSVIDVGNGRITTNYTRECIYRGCPRTGIDSSRC